MSVLDLTQRGFVLGLVSSSAHHLTPVRHDRDEFVRLNEENIAPKMKNNFKKRPFGDAEFHAAGSVDHGHTPYDVQSVFQ